MTALQVLLAKFKLAQTYWNRVIHLILLVFSEAPENSFGENNDGTTRSPFQLMTSIWPGGNHLRVILMQDTILIECSAAEHTRKIDQLQTN